MAFKRLGGPTTADPIVLQKSFRYLHSHGSPGPVDIIYILYMYILCVVSFRRCIHVCSFTTKTAVMKTWRPWDGTGELLSSFIRRGPSTASSVAAESHWGYRHGVPRKRNGFLASRIGGMEQQTKTPFRETESACTQGTGHRPKKA